MGKDLKGKELGSGLSQRKDGMYMGRYVNRFGERKSVYAINLKELKNIYSDAVYEDKNKLNIVDTSITLNKWFEKWIEIHKYDIIRPNTRNTYENVYKKHIAPKLGKSKLSDITTLQIKSILKDLTKKGYKYETQNKVKILLVDMFDKAIMDQFATRNPAKGIKIKRDEKKDLKALSRDEQTVFFDACKGTFYDNLFVVAINTGLRVGEIAGLKWSDIDFNKMEIKVKRTLLYQKIENLGDTKKTFHFSPPKTKTSIREIPITKQCEIALKKQRMQKNVIMSKAPNPIEDEFKDLLFTSKWGTPINAQTVCDAIKRIVDEINLTRDALEEFETFSCHCFRHTFATRCFEADIKPKIVQSYLGHASLNMTMDLYTSVFDVHKKDELDKLENELDRVFSNGDKLIEEEYQKYVENQEIQENKMIKFSII